MNKKQNNELFQKIFGEQPTDSKADKFFLDYLEGLHERRKAKSDRKFKKATIPEVVQHYTGQPVAKS